jgi:hypothetical protein
MTLKRKFSAVTIMVLHAAAALAVATFPEMNI